jgi:hypothetical protein
MKKTILFFAMLAVGLVIWQGCKQDEDIDQTAAAQILSFKVTSPVTTTGTVTGTDITFDLPADKDVTKVIFTAVIPDKVTISPASGSTLDLTSPKTITVTGKDKSGAPVVATYTVTAHLTPVMAFIGKSATINDLEDDAKAAATWMQTTYGNLFTYMPAANITAESMASLNVAFYYELNPVKDEIATNLGAVADKAAIIGNWVRDGGKLFLAGDATDMIFKIGRVPLSEANWNELCCSGVEENHASDDFWGISATPSTTSADRTAHPLFAGLLDDTKKNFYLTNAPTREVRLFWWNVGPSGGNCCGSVDMVTNFEKKYKAIKLGSLQPITDYFGFAAIEFQQTATDTDASFSANVTKDFKGTVLMLSNTIIGYEWNPNNGTNTYQDNVERLTKNAIDYLKGI